MVEALDSISIPRRKYLTMCPICRLKMVAELLSFLLLVAIAELGLVAGQDSPRTPCHKDTLLSSTSNTRPPQDILAWVPQ